MNWDYNQGIERNENEKAEEEHERREHNGNNAEPTANHNVVQSHPYQLSGFSAPSDEESVHVTMETSLCKGEE